MNLRRFATLALTGFAGAVLVPASGLACQYVCDEEYDFRKTVCEVRWQEWVEPEVLERCIEEARTDYETCSDECRSPRSLASESGAGKDAS